MRRLFAFLCILLLAVQFSAAQHNLYVIGKDGGLAAYSASMVSFSDDVFSFSYGDVTNLTKESFNASFKVTFRYEDFRNLKQTPEVGICFSEVNKTPTLLNGKRSLGTSLKSYTFSISGLESGTVYYYRAYVKINNSVFYGAVCKETTLGNKPEYITINGHPFVDLGLPSGLLWAKTNIGAEVAADYGDYFAWGETATKTDYSWATYKHGTSSSNITKYNSADGKTILEKEDDAACVNWGSSCRMPTNTEFAELFNSNNCTWTWISRTTSSGSSVNGYKFTSKKNGNSIFLPASGYRTGENLYCQGTDGYYWSKALNASNILSAYYFNFYSGYTRTSSYTRSYGYTVRPVAVF